MCSSYPLYNVSFLVSYRTDLVKFEWCGIWDQATPVHSLDHDIFSLPHFKLAQYDHTSCDGEYEQIYTPVNHLARILIDEREILKNII